MTFKPNGEVAECTVTEFVYLRDIEEQAVKRYKAKESDLKNYLRLAIVLFGLLVSSVVMFIIIFLNQFATLVGVM